MATAIAGAVSFCTRTVVKSAANSGAFREATIAPAIVAATATATGIPGNRRFAPRPKATLANMMGKM